MAPNPHFKKAYSAMEALGIKAAQVKPVLQNLLTLYYKNWEFIAEDNYRVLTDAIFDSQKAQAIQKRKGKKADEAKEDAGCDRGKKKVHESIEEDDEASSESDRPLKRRKRRGKGGSALAIDGLGNLTLEEPPAYGEETALILLPFHAVPTENDPDADLVGKGDSSVPMLEIEKTNGHVEEWAGEIVSTLDGTTNDVSSTTVGRFSEHKLAATIEEPSALELASSALGEVKINLSFPPATEGSNLHVPSKEELRRAMEEKCLRSYKILDPNFSVLGFMNDICSCYLDLATKGKDSANQLPKNLPFASTHINALKKSAASMAFTSQGSKEHMGDVENGSVSDTRGLVVVPECQLSADEWRLISNIRDITLGKETIEIPWVNEVNDKVPPGFRYIAQSLVYQDAAVKFSLGNIRDDQCCSSCLGDCLDPSMACSCATAYNGFAYTLDGLLQKDFLEQCISEARDPQKHMVQYCKECPLEKAKKEVILESCKGHLKRKAIKECWSKCGCTKKCGNRVVQQGMQNKLQVFFTPNGRGWGLRTLEKLPKGAFICEFVGEILTISELFQRNSESHTSVVLDAYWNSEDISRDDKALCLDGMHYGNISRFINHRCVDANLIEIPVHVETTDLHYYHLAFFTTREIDAMEELTWDNGALFKDDVFPTNLFHCRCGSEFCRSVKQISTECVAYKAEKLPILYQYKRKKGAQKA